ncbi:UV-damage endonuclease [Clostridium cavendishii DSM 21758]|uniref:UV-damage endonuclease n=1 Tax=Clostridium cavendishii DSM 21758 TaxID=1121302 RepID=A0A1M6B9M1_9CLOT|nr:UV DNA damage repair endonuclease UvsE [Clostridium cavendishii]SHI45278.1 UV-damage endonuclease [Clostridium cavendishii DSM 21758]
MKIGYACIPITIPYRTNRKLFLKDYSEEKLIEILKYNLEDLKYILMDNLKNNIYMFRISSDIVPLGSHEINTFDWSNYFKNELREIGNYAKNNNIRLSMHPGQYTVINSPDPNIVSKSIRDIEYHCLFLDSLDVDYSNKIVLHIGGVYGDKNASIKRFINSFDSLSTSAQKRLIIENDEKNFSLDEVFYISKTLNIPMVYDNLHNDCYGDNNYSFYDIYSKVITTWKECDGQMKVHYSQQALDKKMGSHSNTIFIKDFLRYYNEIKEFNADIMLEVKDKDISAIKCINVLEELNNSPLKISKLYEEWAKYKYLIMEHDYSFYKQVSSLVKNNCSFLEFYSLVDDALNKPLNIGSQKNTFDHVWGYVKNNASNFEKNHFAKLMSSEDMSKVKLYLKKLCSKYNSEYMLNSYFFSQ